MTASDAEIPGGSGEGEQQLPGDVDDAVWTELVASFHSTPAPDEGGWPEAENVPPPPPEDTSRVDGAVSSDAGAPPSRVVRPAVRPGSPDSTESAEPAEATDPPESPARPAPASITWIEGLVQPRPARDWTAREEPEEGFVPPTPPPLPEIAAATKAAWLAGLGGPAILMLSTILHWNTPSWAALLCVLGGVAGFGYLVSRLKDRPDGDDDDPDDPTYGAVL